MQDFVKDLDYIKSRFNYCSESGTLTWKPNYTYPAWWNTKYAGTSPSNTDKLGYIRAKLTRVVNGEKISAYVSCHRICFFMHNGWLPEVVDHIDGNKKNNKSNNLRAADMQKNSWNRFGNKDTATGYKVVSINRYRKGSNKGEIYGYIARVRQNGKCEYLGVFPTAELANDAARKKEKEVVGDWMRKS